MTTEVTEAIGYLISPRMTRMGWLSPLAWIVTILRIVTASFSCDPWRHVLHPHSGVAP